MKSILILFFCLFTSNLLFSQEDSLLRIIPNSTDKEKANIYLKLAEMYLYKTGNKTEDYCLKSIDFAQKSKYRWCEAYSLRVLGIYYDIHGDYEKALEVLNKGLAINKEIKDDGGISACLSSLGIIYFNRGKYDKALEKFLEVIPYFEKSGSGYNQSLTISNIAAIYKYNNDNVSAIKYYREALRLMIKDGSRKGLGISYNNLGMAFLTAKTYDSALIYMSEGLKIKIEIGDKRSLSYSYSNLSSLAQKMGNLDQALEYLNECIALQTELGDKKGIANSHIAMGDILVEKKESPDVYIPFYEKTYQMAKEFGDFHLNQLSALKLAEAFYLKQEYQKSADYMYVYSGYRDSIYNSEKAKSFAEMQTKFDTEKKEKEIALLNIQNAKKELQLSVANNEKLKREKDLELMGKEKEIQHVQLEKANADKEAEMKQNEVLKKDKLLQSEKLKKEKAEKEILNEQNRKKEQQIYAFSIGSLLLVTLLFFVVRGYRHKKKANELLAMQNIEINKQKEEITLQSEIIEEKNRDVMSSITYAKRLQDAILPSPQRWNAILPDSFILYLPKDIVAGDFYFLEKVNDLIIVAAADSTGHGVPGAMVSVVCSNALNRAVKEFKLIDPGKILDKVREMVLETFAESGGEVKDGMDISLAVLDLKNSTMKWAGANNPMLIIRKNGNEFTLLEFVADKQPIGFAELKNPFTTNEIAVQKEDTLYFITDGYADQFGGAKKKKLKIVNLKNIFLENGPNSMQEIGKDLANKFEAWKGDLEQIDDVCIIGVRV